MLQQARVAAIVPVSDVEAAIRFYGDTLGLRLTRLCQRRPPTSTLPVTAVKPGEWMRSESAVKSRSQPRRGAAMTIFTLPKAISRWRWRLTQA